VTVRRVPPTSTTPAHLVTSTRYGKAVYVNEVFKGSVEPMRTPGFFKVRGADRHLVENPDDVDGLWDHEDTAVSFLART
jgi:hypothetical protein